MKIAFSKRYSVLGIVLSLLMLTLGWLAREASDASHYRRPITGDLPIEFAINTTTNAFEGSYVFLPLPFTASEIKNDIEIRRKNLQRLVSESDYNSDPKIPITDTISETEEYTEYRALIPTEPGYPGVTAALFIPKNITLPAPAILFLHGHFEDNTLFKQPPGQGRAANFHAIEHAKAGFITLALENRGTGGFRIWQGMNQIQYMNYELLQERSFIPLALRDAEKALVYLQNRPEVDSNRLGVAGVSLGGELAMFMGALHTEIKAVAVSGFVNIYQGLLQGHVHDLYWHGVLRRVGEIPQIASLISPRPLLIQHGLSDEEFYKEGTVRENAYNAVEYIREIYRKVNTDNALEYVTFDGGHIYENDSSLSFFKRVLSQ